jgi:transcriptional regulator with XRE-family HTH domain
MTYSINTEETQALRLWLKRARKSKKVSMRALGETLGQPHSFVQKVESGERRLDVVEFVWYCRALGIDAHAGLDQIMASSLHKRI